MLPQYQQDFLTSFDFVLPQDYLAYLLAPESVYEFDGAYLIEKEGLMQYNADYHAIEFYTGYFLIGSNGGGEALAIEKSTGFFVVIPFIGHDEESPITIGRTWVEARQRIQTGTLFDEDSFKDE